MIITAKEITYKNIINKISLSHKKGDFLGIIGPNGAGKSTLLKLLCGIFHLDSGKILIDSIDINNLKTIEIAQKIAYIPQELNIMHDITVKDFLTLSRYSFFENTKFSKEQVEKAAYLCNIEMLLNRNLRTLSGGEKQKVQIAGAVSQGSSLWLCDEPTSSLDPGAKFDFYNLIDDISSKKELSLIIATHDLSELLYRTNKVISLKNGEVFLEGNSEDFTDSVVSKLYDANFDIINQKNKRIFVISG